MQVPEYPVIARAVENEVYFYLCLARDELGKRHASALLARTVVHQRLAELRDRLILLKYVPEGTRAEELSDHELAGLLGGTGSKVRGVGPQKTSEMLVGRILGHSDDWYRQHVMGGPVGDRPGRRLQRYGVEQALLPPMPEPDPWSYAAKLIAARAAADPQMLWQRFAVTWNRIMLSHPERRTVHGQPIVMFCEWCGCQLGAEITKPYCSHPATCESEAGAKKHGRTLKKTKRV
jgi:hypothetical protein